MKYELASTSDEKNEEIVDFPYKDSYLKYSFSPKNKFVGDNSIPNFMNYNCNGMSNKLKKELKTDYPYINFTILGQEKDFFTNKFKFLTDLKSEKVSLDKIDQIININSKLMDSKIKENVIDKEFCMLSSSKDAYLKLFTNFFFDKSDFLTLIKKYNQSKMTNIFVLESRVLEYLDDESSYVYLRVADTCIDDVKYRKYAFQNVFHSKMKFFDYLNLVKDRIVKNFDSYEIEILQAGERSALCFVYNNIITYNDKTLRLIDGFGSKKNFDILLNKEAAHIHDFKFIESNPINLNICKIINLDLKEGDYAIGEGKVYKISEDGNSIKFHDIDYSDFI